MLMGNRRRRVAVCSRAMHAVDAQRLERAGHENILGRLENVALFTTRLVAHAESLCVGIRRRKTERWLSTAGRRVARHAFSGQRRMRDHRRRTGIQSAFGSLGSGGGLHRSIVTGGQTAGKRHQYHQPEA